MSEERKDYTGIDLDAIAGRLRNVTTADLRYAGRGSIDVLLRTEQDGTETWARYLEVFGPNVAGSYKDPAPLDAESDFFMHAREDVAMLIDGVRQLARVRTGALAEIQSLSGAMRADNWRLQNAGQRVGIIAGCDTPDQMAEEILKLRADIERIGAERDQMEAANKQQADEISRLNAIIAGMASLPATSEPRS